ncbi:MAG: amino acid permease [Candidatus Eremiobacteraeota bacterium]|nr:amino acid permease [Candidatus Eremiobacteraeota bacterium]
MPKLLRRLGTRDAALIVMGGIIGSGIFMNPSVVARHVHSAALVMLVWAAGGLVILMGGGIFAELAARRPHDGGVYAYMRDAFHPSLAFMYGWTLLLVSQSGGAAAAAVTFARYFMPLTGWQLSSGLVAAAAIACFTAINALGVRSGATTQNVFMILKILAIGGFIAVGLVAPHAAPLSHPTTPDGSGIAAAIGLALVPVLFAYSGWQTSSFLTAELKEPHVTLPRGMIAGVVAVIVLYLAVNAVSLRTLGVEGLAATSTPASDIARLAFGPIGLRIMATVIALSTLGFLSNQILTSPRVYFQMAADGTFFKQFAAVSSRTHAPVVAIVAQGLVALIIAFLPYEKILNYVTCIDYIFFGFAAIALIVFRNRDARDPAAPTPIFRTPGHPVTTLVFLAVAWGVVGDVMFTSPETIVGIGILLSGLPVYWFFTRRASGRPGQLEVAEELRQ